MKLINFFIYLIILLCSLSISLFAEINPKFGFRSSFNYIDLKESQYIHNSVFSNDTYFYLGLEYIESSYYFSFKPAISLYTKENRDIIFDNGNIIKKADNRVYASFLFNEIQFTYINNIIGFYIGKRKFHFGEGFNRQYMFVDESVLYNDFNSLYNTEINIYQNNITHSIGFITDTKSIDLLKNPTYYKAWYYVKYSDSYLGLMGITKYTYTLNNENNLMLGFEASYIFDIGLKIYGNVVYDILSKNKIGDNANDVKSLIGINYNFIYNFILSPYVEYFYENNYFFYSIGLYTSFFDNILNFITYFSHSPQYQMQLNAKLLVNINNFNFTFNYYTPLQTDEVLENVFELSFEYKY